ncbi:hypothetical protein HBH56_029350 [Parastagonospora nodorum]|nr:hypothetical protein HBH56_029350 [Parastagonospora nodorum]QRC99191.1 hypothetical protein JI435_065230 [Parastagonospora nodorum SN15]KAH3934185.1 hypothetical protein HBH54_052680 [Parastagonospora nodorum]KAH4038964.1 hypothetical protein HBI09_042090 [Parastagonospora nodorum]KAH4142009.1 hypothetical protein HBH45_064110 [Parastagonospora nodorum]
MNQINQMNQLWQSLKPQTPNKTPPNTCTCLPISPPNTQVMLPQPSSRLLTLPLELRLQIYTHLDLTAHTIAVLSAPVCQLHPDLDHLWHRIEAPADREPTTLPHYTSLPGLFGISSTCRQLQAETTDFVLAGNSWAFTDTRYNYATAFPLWLGTLSAKQRESIRTIHWPLRHARDVQQFGDEVQAPDRACRDELRCLTGLERVVLRYVGTDVGAARLGVGEREEFERQGETGYVEERRFRRELAVRGMRGLVGREEVQVVCEKTWRARF